MTTFETIPQTVYHVPTYYGSLKANRDETYGSDKKQEFDGPNAQVTVRASDAVYVDLGPRVDGCDPPNVIIERRANGWMVTINAEGGGDSSGHIYMIDDGRAFAMKGCDIQCESNLIFVKRAPKSVDRP